MKTANQLLQNNGVGLVTPKEGATDYIIPVCYDKASNVLKTKDENGVVIEIGGGSTEPYLEYVAMLNQSGTNAPVATILKNTLGVVPVWTRTGTGEYLLTSVGAFTANKTEVIVPTAWSSAQPAQSPQYLSAGSDNTDSIYLNSADWSLFNNLFEAKDNLLFDGYSVLTIRVWL